MLDPFCKGQQKREELRNALPRVHTVNCVDAGPLPDIASSLRSSRCGADALCGDHHSPIQGPRKPYGDAPVAGLTNLLYEVLWPHQTNPARTQPAPQLCYGAYRLRISTYYSCHLLLLFLLSSCPDKFVHDTSAIHTGDE